MIATTSSTALATVQPAFTDSERLALAGFLARYRGLTREAYTFDLRQFTVRCQARSLPLFAIRRADIETFARDLEARGPLEVGTVAGGSRGGMMDAYPACSSVWVPNILSPYATWAYS
jgi:hypothetical protein